MSQTGPFYFRRIQWAGSYFTSADFDIRDLYIEVERLAGQRVIEVNEDGFVLDLVNAPSFSALLANFMSGQYGKDTCGPRTTTNERIVVES
jgi:hypothetical protein